MTVEYEQEIREIRTKAQEILDKESKMTDRPWFQLPWDSRREHIFDTRDKSVYPLLTRAASRTSIAPAIKIREDWDSCKKRTDLEIELSAKNPKTGALIPIIDLAIDHRSDSDEQSKVILWSEPILGMIPYRNFRRFDQAILITEVMIPSLDAINRYLNRTSSR